MPVACGVRTFRVIADESSRRCRARVTFKERLTNIRSPPQVLQGPVPTRVPLPLDTPDAEQPELREAGSTVGEPDMSGMDACIRQREVGEEMRQVVDKADAGLGGLGVPRPDSNGPVAVRGVLPAHTTRDGLEQCAGAADSRGARQGTSGGLAGHTRGATGARKRPESKKPTRDNAHSRVV